MAKAAYPTIGIAALVMFGIVYFIGCLQLGNNLFWKYAFMHLLLLEYMKWLNIKDIKDLVLRIVYTVKIMLIAMTAQENYAACINI